MRFGWLAIIIVVLSLGGCDLCSKDTALEAISPNGHWVAKVVEVNCGATTPYTEWVTLRRKDAWFGSDEIVFSVREQPAMEIQWRDDSTLLIRCRGCKK
jgi:hypothetical protein